MKLRLPNKLIAAIVAAASPVLFSTLSTATLGAAAVATLSQQAKGFTPPTGVVYTGEATVTTSNLAPTLTENTAIAIQDAVAQNSGNIVINGAGYDIKITGAGDNDMVDLGKVTANSIWFANGRFRIDEAAGSNHLFNGVSTVYVGGSQLWFTDNADYSGENAITSNFVLGNAKINEGYPSLDYSALRIAKNTEINGSVTIDNEGSKISFQGGGNLTLNGALKGSGNLAFDLYAGNSTLFITGDTSAYSGSMTVRSGNITLNFGGGTEETPKTHTINGITTNGALTVADYTTLVLTGTSSLKSATLGTNSALRVDGGTVTLTNNDGAKDLLIKITGESGTIKLADGLDVTVNGTSGRKSLFKGVLDIGTATLNLGNGTGGDAGNEPQFNTFSAIRINGGTLQLTGWACDSHQSRLIVDGESTFRARQHGNSGGVFYIDGVQLNAALNVLAGDNHANVVFTSLSGAGTLNVKGSATNDVDQLLRVSDMSLFRGDVNVAPTRAGSAVTTELYAGNGNAAIGNLTASGNATVKIFATAANGITVNNLSTEGETAAVNVGFGSTTGLLTVNGTLAGKVNVKGSSTLTLGATSSVEAEKTATLTVDNNATVVFADTLANAGTLTISGGKITALNSAGFEQYREGTTSAYSGENDYAGSGFQVASDAVYYLVKGSGTTTISNATLTNGRFVTADGTETGDILFSYGTSEQAAGTRIGNIYYVNSDLNYNETEMLGTDKTVTLSVAEGQTLTFAENASVKTAFDGPGHVEVAAGKTLTINLMDGDVGNQSSTTAVSHTTHLGNVVLNGGSELKNNSNIERAVRVLDSLTVNAGDSAAKLTQNSWNTWWDIATLQGDGNLQWLSQTTHNNSSIMFLRGAGTFSGELDFFRDKAVTNRNYQAFIEIDHANALAHGTLNLRGSGATSQAALALNAATVNLKGLKGNANSIVFAGAAPLAVTATAPVSTSTSELVIDTDSGKTYTYAGAVQSGVSLQKNGAGVQELTGNLSAFDGDLTVNAGTLTITGTTLPQTGTAAEGTRGKLTLNGGTLKVGSGDSNETSLSSFSSVELAGGVLYYNNKKDTLHNVTAKAGTDSRIFSFDMGAKNDGCTLTLAGTTTLNGNLTINNYWNAAFVVEQLAGSGTFTFTGADSNGNVAVTTSQDGDMTIQSLLGFTGNLTFNSTGARVTVNTGAASVSMGTLSVSNRSEVTVNSNSGVFNASSLALSGNPNYAATALTFNGAAAAISGNITAEGGGTINVSGTAPITANTITITNGTKLNFDQLVTLTGDARPNFLYGEGGDHTGTELNFNGGFAYTGAGNQNDYAMVVGSNVTVGLGGTSNLGTKNIGMQANALLKLKDGASLTVNRIYNVDAVANNGNVSVGANATLTTTATAANRVNVLTIGSGSTTTFGGETNIGTLNAASGGTLNFAKAGTINSASRPTADTTLTALNLTGDQKVTFQHDAAVSIGSSALANGSTLSLHYNNDSSKAVTIGELSLTGAAATVESIWHGGVVNLQNLVGEEKTLNLKNSGSSDRHTTFSLGGSASTAAQAGFSGTIALNHSDAGTDRGTVLILNDEYTTSQSVLKVTAAETSSARLLAIGLNSDTVRMLGLHDERVGAVTSEANAALSHYTLFSGSGSNLANRFTGSNRATYMDNAADGKVRTLELTGSGDYETSIKVDKNINLVMIGTGTQSFSGNMENFSGSITATQGTLQFLQQATSVNVENLTITGQDATHRAEVGVYSTATKDTAHEAGISVSGTLTANQHATLNANLTMESGSTLDVDHTTGGLHMGSSLTLSGNNIHVNQSITDALNAMCDDLLMHGGIEHMTGDRGLTLFSGVDSFFLGTDEYDSSKTYAATNYFDLSGVQRPWDFVIKFDDVARSQSGGVVYLYMETPEPATATLSLLALAALAARRKRK